MLWELFFFSFESYCILSNDNPVITKGFNLCDSWETDKLSKQKRMEKTNL
jgi:hypothetical protein